MLAPDMMFRDVAMGGVGALTLGAVLWLATRIAYRLAHGRWTGVDPSVPPTTSMLLVPVDPEQRGVKAWALRQLGGLAHRVGDLVLLLVGFAAFHGLRLGGQLLRQQYPFNLQIRDLADGLWGAAATVGLATSLALLRRGKTRRRARRLHQKEEDTYYWMMLKFLFGLPTFLGSLGYALYLWKNPPVHAHAELHLSAVAYGLTLLVCYALVAFVAAGDAELD